MLFKDVIGQDQLKNHLIELVENNRLSHALLFVGKEGSGALPLALAMAGYIACLQPAQAENGPDLFGSFDSAPAKSTTQSPVEHADNLTQKHPAFSKVRNMVHPDIHYSYPVITKKQERRR